MFTRSLTPLNSSFFLFGPRGTGKSTWIQQHFPEVKTYDLLNRSLVLELSRNPSKLYEECSLLPNNAWVVIDEVQKVPELLDEVHRLIEQRKLRFILSGSSARKLKQAGINLLAGRAITQHLYPLTSKEVDFAINISDRLVYGMLPVAFTSEDPKPYLRTYVETYLSEEIKAEALTRNIGNFSRFLEIAARNNAQTVNSTNVSRDAQVARQTVDSYYDILIDTLVGFRLPAWKKKSATRQRSLSKFYFFDAGVARALSERLPYPPTHEELGPLFETFIIQELKAYLAYTNKHYPLHYWSKHVGGGG
ncbi:AAA family ATPase [Oligoflexia bacterium]|nr:AAA family ATPase [Oligoflexia bacterium]